MSWEIISVILLFTIGGSFIQRVTGFGFGILMMTMLPFLMPSYAEATALTGLLAVVTACVTFCFYVRYLSLKRLLPILLTFLVVAYFSIGFVTKIDSHSMKKVLGVILILASAYFLFLKSRLAIKPSIGAQVGLGTLSGIMGGLFSMQGPAAVIYFISITDDKKEYQALCSTYFFIGNIAMTLFRAQNGIITPTVLHCWLWAVPGIAIGQFLGAKIYNRLPIQTIRKVVYIYMAFAGLVALIR